MNLATIARFNLGQAGAIREVARNRSALWAAIVLVLLTGVARNYDQNFILETPFWLIGPLLFSFFSGSFLYAVVIRGFARRHFENPEGASGQWRTFMTLFWMTAPSAWLYAIPVERFLDFYQAAQANLTLLAVVSVWRVLLMSRILAVMLNIPFLRTLGWVLLAAAAEVIVVFFFGLLFGGGIERRVLSGMSGMRNAPDEDLLLRTLNLIWNCSWALLVGTIACLAIFRFTGVTQPLPRSTPGKFPILSILTLAVTWTLIAIPPQREQRHFATHAALIRKQEYPNALSYLAQKTAADFPKGRRLEPNPYEYEVWRDLPPTITLLTSNTPVWIRQTYLNHLTATFSHLFPSYNSLTNVALMYSAIERLPEGPGWLATNQNDMARRGLNLRFADESERAEQIARSNILQTFRRMGMSPTNLEQIE